MSEKKRETGSGLSRRTFVKTGALALGSTMMMSPSRLFAQSKKPIELVHWSWLVASDGEIWQEMIDAFNAAHKDQGIQIRMEIIPDDKYMTKLLAAAAAGTAPDFGWGIAGVRAKQVKQGVMVPMKEAAKEVGLDLSDFSENVIKACQYPLYSDDLFMVPMDLMSLQPLVNLDHVAEAGLKPEEFPKDGKSLIEWAQAMTQSEGGKVKRSGILMTGDGLQPAVTWAIIARQMGFQRVSDDMKTAAVNPEAGLEAMKWVLDLFDAFKVSSREVTDRYRAFGAGQGSIFWTGPWTLPGYQKQGLKFGSFLFPKVGKELHTYIEIGGLEMYLQKDKDRYLATMQAIKWLSDNSFKWTTEGRGVSPRKSIVSRPDYKTSGLPWDLRGAFVDGMAFATIGEVPVPGGPDFTAYSGNNFATRTLSGVWMKEKKPEQAMEELKAQWQKDLDEA